MCAVELEQKKVDLHVVRKILLKASWVHKEVLSPKEKRNFQGEKRNRIVPTIYRYS